MIIMNIYLFDPYCVQKSLLENLNLNLIPGPLCLKPVCFFQRRFKENHKPFLFLAWKPRANYALSLVVKIFQPN